MSKGMGVVSARRAWLGRVGWECPGIKKPECWRLEGPPQGQGQTQGQVHEHSCRHPPHHEGQKPGG